jgi:tetratricopeptide (TPR) repeat protein
VAFFEQALAALQHLPETRDTLEQAVDVRLDLRQPLLPVGDIDQILVHLRQAETTAEKLNDQRRLARTLSWLAYSYGVTVGDYEHAIATGHRALAIGRMLDDVPVQVTATFYLALAHHQQGDYSAAIADFKSMVNIQGDLVHERFGMTGYPSVLARGLLAWGLGDIGEFSEGRAYAAEAIRLAAALDQPFSHAVLRNWLGHFYIVQGDLPIAISLLEEGCALVARWDLPRLAPATLSLLGIAYALDGRAVQAAPLLTQAAVQVESDSWARSTDSRLSHSALCEGYLLAGRIEEAVRLADCSLDISRKRGLRGSEAQALRLLGDIAACRDPPDADEAERRYDESLVLAERLEMRPLQARCHLGLGKLYQQTGRADRARVELSAAVAMLRAMEMTLWLPEAEAALAEVERTLSSGAAAASVGIHEEDESSIGASAEARQ